ncbi:MAG: GNAT family N-acetyltransferase [Sphingomonadales bacterium]
MLRGEVVGLRAIEHGDLRQLLDFRNQPNLRQYFREYRELSFRDQENWFNERVLRDPATRMFAIEELASGRLMGACGLCYISPINRSADFSIYIGADNLYIDDLYAPDAGKLLIHYGFSELNLNRIWAEIYDFDSPKIRYFEQMGFTLEGRHRQTRWTQSRFVDSLFWSLLAGDPQAAAP